MNTALEHKRPVILLVALVAVTIIGFAVGRASGGEDDLSSLQSVPAAGSVAIDGVSNAGALPDLRPAPKARPELPLTDKPPTEVAPTEVAPTEVAPTEVAPTEVAPTEPPPPEPPPPDPDPPEPPPDPDPPIVSG